MAYSRVRIQVPDIQQSFRDGSYNYSNPSTKDSNSIMIRSIDTRYGRSIDRWSTVFEIPRGVIIAFIATESGGKANAISSVGCCFGLMQVSPDGLWEAARKWSREVSVPLSRETVKALTSKVSDFFTSKSSQPSSSQSSRIRNALLTDTDFSIMTGTLMLRWLIERFSNVVTGGQLNKAIVAFNAGPYVKVLQVPGTSTTPNEIPIDSTSLVNNRRVPAESRGYLLKMLGIDGFMSLIYKDKVTRGI